MLKYKSKYKTGGVLLINGMRGQMFGAKSLRQRETEKILFQSDFFISKNTNHKPSVLRSRDG